MKLILIFVSFIALFAFDNNPIKTTIITSSKTTATIEKNIPAGVTGYVINNDNMMIAKAISLGNNSVKYLPLTKLKNEALATPKVIPSTDDTIIFGLYNNRALIIAPNQNTYLKTKSNNPNTTFVSSDIFATYFTSKPDKEDFNRFCSDFNVGIIYFLLDKQYIVDCDSFVILDTKNIKSQKYTKALFVNYKKLNDSVFSSKPNNWINYYKSLLKVSNGK